MPLVRLEDIGFYTLSDARAANASATSPLQRCELILTGRCNFRCPYCRRIGGPDLEFPRAEAIVRQWCADGLTNIRFSGGEPTMYPRLGELVKIARCGGVKRIAVSTNGSADLAVYLDLIDCGVNDFSVSLDACCAEDGDKMAGGVKGAWGKVVANIEALSARIYLTVGIVLTEQNVSTVGEIIAFAAGLGVSDVRVIPAAQNGDRLRDVVVSHKPLERYPILRYRIANIQAGRPVRGLSDADPRRCGLVLDDMAVCGEHHYPCIIYLREGGKPIGRMGPNARAERQAWSEEHDCHADPICRKNCLDVCVDYNRKYREAH